MAKLKEEILLTAEDNTNKNFDIELSNKGKFVN